MGSTQGQTAVTTTRIGSTSQGLAFLALAGFAASFFAARIFTTLNPDDVVVSSGIHFHHFWYGLVMICVAGWLGIASTRPEYDRAYALIFGLGLGLVGDETGLLLTLGNYYSELTYIVTLGGIAFVGMAYLTFRYSKHIKNEVLLLDRGERTVHLGVGIMAVSSLALAFDHLFIGVAVLAAGLVLTFTGIWLHINQNHGDSTNLPAPGNRSFQPVHRRYNRGSPP